MLRHPDSWMRSSGLWALSQVDLPHLLFKALELCSDSEPHVRVHALRAIGKKGNREIARHLSPWLSDPYSQVREAAQKAIEKQMGLNYQV
jgi:HEAT repeat protein